LKAAGLEVIKPLYYQWFFWILVVVFELEATNVSLAQRKL